MHFPYFSSQSLTFRKSEIIQIGKIKGIYLSEPDRDEWLKYFQENERSILVKETYAWLLSNANVRQLRPRDLNKLRKYLLQQTESVIDVEKASKVLTHNHLFRSYAHYHYLIHLHRHHGMLFVSHKGCAGYYHRSLTSRHWAMLRDAKFLEQNGLCAGKKCSATPNDLHHIHYRNIGRERLSDVEGYCTSCHDQLHLNFGFPTIAEHFEQQYFNFFADHLVA